MTIARTPKTLTQILTLFKSNISQVERVFGRHKLVDDFTQLQNHLSLANSNRFKIFLIKNHLVAAKEITDRFFNDNGTLKPTEELHSRNPIFLNLLYAYQKYAEDKVDFIAQYKLTCTVVGFFTNIPPFEIRAQSIKSYLKQASFNNILDKTEEAKCQSSSKMGKS